MLSSFNSKSTNLFIPLILSRSTVPSGTVISIPFTFGNMSYPITPFLFINLSKNLPFPLFYSKPFHYLLTHSIHFVRFTCLHITSQKPQFYYPLTYLKSTFHICTTEHSSLTTFWAFIFSRSMFHKEGLFYI